MNPMRIAKGTLIVANAAAALYHGSKISQDVRVSGANSVPASRKVDDKTSELAKTLNLDSTPEVRVLKGVGTPATGSIAILLNEDPLTDAMATHLDPEAVNEFPIAYHLAALKLGHPQARQQRSLALAASTLAVGTIGMIATKRPVFIGSMAAAMASTHVGGTLYNSNQLNIERRSADLLAARTVSRETLLGEIKSFRMAQWLSEPENQHAEGLDPRIVPALAGAHPLTSDRISYLREVADATAGPIIFKYPDGTIKTMDRVEAYKIRKLISAAAPGIRLLDVAKVVVDPSIKSANVQVHDSNGFVQFHSYFSSELGAHLDEVSSDYLLQDLIDHRWAAFGVVPEALSNAVAPLQPNLESRISLISLVVCPEAMETTFNITTLGEDSAIRTFTLIRGGERTSYGNSPLPTDAIERAVESILTGHPDSLVMRRAVSESEDIAAASKVVLTATQEWVDEANAKQETALMLESQIWA
jgi:hypothetical protein